MLLSNPKNTLFCPFCEVIFPFLVQIISMNEGLGYLVQIPIPSTLPANGKGFSWLAEEKMNPMEHSQTHHAQVPGVSMKGPNSQ